jgi:hypothetical protein
MMLRVFRGLLDGVHDARVGSTTADISLHELHDFSGRGARLLREERHAADDHSGGAVGALESFEIEEGLLHGMQMAIFFEAFDCGDGLYDFAEGKLAGTARRAADQDRAGTALPFTAAVFCAGESKFVAENGEEAGIWIGVDWVFLTVNFEFEWRSHGASRRFDFLTATACEV